MTDVQFLTNDIVHELLINLSRDETVTFQNTIEQTFEDFSIGGERKYQPDPTAANRPNGQRTLFRPFTSDTSVGAKLVVEPAPKPDGKKDPLHGILILADGMGNFTGVMAAEEVTGYRTSMNVMVPFSWRKHVDNIVIFGGGMQALWHTRLILNLRGSEVKTITYVNPFKDQVDTLIAKVSQENNARWKSNCTFNFVNTTAPDFQQQIEARLSNIDCVFCTTPSKKPLFPACYLKNSRSDGRRPFISAIGSWQSDMIELDPALLHHSIEAEGGYNPASGENKGVVLVDDRDYALKNSGEVVQSKVTGEDLVELGQIVALRKGRTQPLNDKHLDDTNKFISEGFVVYKSIGVSLTDLTAGNAVLALSKKKQARL